MAGGWRRTAGGSSLLAKDVLQAVIGRSRGGGGPLRASAGPPRRDDPPVNELSSRSSSGRFFRSRPTPSEAGQ